MSDASGVTKNTRAIQRMLKPSPCLHNGNEVDDWMGLDEWNSWFKSQVQNSNRSQEISSQMVDLSTFQLKRLEQELQKQEMDINVSSLVSLIPVKKHNAKGQNKH
ncbi:hypothetical protein TNCV_3754091 [Trichonephila clavipes]|nr:hypothetical protein TNCV_3754091 [Trichonephila clavipes]